MTAPQAGSRLSHLDWLEAEAIHILREGAAEGCNPLMLFSAGKDSMDLAHLALRKSEYGTHSLRRTKAAMIYRATGNIRAIQILLGHTKIENTVRYLGVDVEDALDLAEYTEA